MTGSFILDYYLLILLASIGLFQVVAAHKGLRGMHFFNHRRASFVLGLALLFGAVTWFFMSEPRNVSDSDLGLNGNEQFAYFFAGIGTGLAITLIIASLCNRRLGIGLTILPSGLDALREATYIRASYRTGRLLWLRICHQRNAAGKHSVSQSGSVPGRLAGNVLGRSIISGVAARVVDVIHRSAVIRRRGRSWG